MSNQIHNILVVGTVRNVSKNLAKEIEKLHCELTKIANVSFYIVESDSDDDTLNILHRLADHFPRFKFETAGKLQGAIPDRIARIRYCRNLYVKFIRKNHTKESYEFIVVADLDGMNNKITAKRVKDSVNKLKMWSALFSNQLFAYYDIYALRCTGWVDKDLLAETRKMSDLLNEKGNDISRYIRRQLLRQQQIYSKMHTVLPWRPVISVQSAFGGFGIYKSELFLKYDYSISDVSQQYECEHVAFHTKCIQDGYLIGINPKMINNYFNEYNLNKIILIRIARDFKRFFAKSIRGTK